VPTAGAYIPIWGYPFMTLGAGFLELKPAVGTGGKVLFHLIPAARTFPLGLVLGGHYQVGNQAQQVGNQGRHQRP